MDYFIAKFPKLLGSLFVCIIFFLGAVKSRKGLYFCVFLMPYEGVVLKNFGLPGFFVISYFLGYFFRSFMIRERFWKNIYYRKYILFIIFAILVSSISFALKKDYSNLMLLSTSSSIISPFIRYIYVITSAIMLYILICNEIKTYQDITKFIIAFNLSLSYLFITWIGDYIFHFNLPSLLLAKVSGGGSVAQYSTRFAGYTAEYGLTAEYLMIIIAFSVLFIFAQRKMYTTKFISAVTIIIAILMAISTGTRAFVVVLFLFSAILLFLLTLVRAISIGKSSAIIISLIIILIFTGYMLKGSQLSERMDESKQIANINKKKFAKGNIAKIEKLLNRTYFSAFEDIVDVAGFWGVGPLNITGVNNIAFCRHSLYYDLYIKFGVIGLTIYLTFYLKLLIDLYKKIRLKGTSQRIMPIVLFSLFLPLLLGEYARSYQNQVSFMLIYWFLFAIIACVNKLEPVPDMKK